MRAALPALVHRLRSYVPLGTDKPSADRRVSIVTRVSAGLASWLILGGLIMLPAAFDTSDEYRFSKTGIAIFAAALVLLGNLIVVYLSCTTHHFDFRADALLYPAAISSMFGFLNTLYSFIICKRYTWNIPAIFTTALSASLATVYALLHVHFHRTARRQRADKEARRLTSTSFDDTHSSNRLRHDRQSSQSYYSNYVNNMYPMMRSPSIATSVRPPNREPIQDPTSHPRPRSTTQARQPQASVDIPRNQDDDDPMRQQMLNLLRTQQHTPDPSYTSADPTLAPKNSYHHIDWSPAMTSGADSSQPVSALTSTAYRSPGDAHGVVSPLSRADTLAQLQRPGHTQQQHDNVQYNGIQTQRRPSPHTGQEQERTPIKTVGGPGWSAADVATEEQEEKLLHPVYRESRMLQAAPGEREARRREIEGRGVDGG